MFNLFKKKEFVEVTRSGKGIMVNCRVDPSIGMSMLLGALEDMAERFMTNHAKKEIKCDCLGIRYATLITHHIKVIHNEMSKIKLKKK